MVAQDLEVVSAIHDAFARRDLDALIAIADPEIRIRSLLTEAERPYYDGHDGVRDWYAAIFEVFPDWQPRIVNTWALGEGAVLLAIDVTGTSSGAEVPIHQAFWQSMRIRNQKLVWSAFHRTEADALEALGARS